MGNEYDKIDEAARVAIEETSKVLDAWGVRHALIGGLALGAHGYHRATRDVDWLIGDEGVSGGLIVTYTFNAPRSVGAYAVDYFTQDATDPDDQKLVADLLGTDTPRGSILVASPEYITWSKLRRFSPKDREDIRQLIDRGALVVSEFMRWLREKGVSEAAQRRVHDRMTRIQEED